MRAMLLLIACSALVACVSEPLDITACTQPRPEICTLEHAPTCAVLDSGERKEYSSPCVACSNVAVTGFVNGPCPE